MLTFKKVVQNNTQKIIGFDTETYMITNNTCPPVVCLTTYTPESGGKIFVKENIEKEFKRLLKSDCILVAHNAAFDTVALCVSFPSLHPLIWEAYSAGRIQCTMIRESMIQASSLENFGNVGGRIQGGFSTMSCLSLGGCLLKYFGKDISRSKFGDVWRTKYKELESIELEEWPNEAIDYAIADSEYAFYVYLAQEKKELLLRDAARQAQAAHVLSITGNVIGVGVDTQFLEKKKTSIVESHKRKMAPLEKMGLYQEDPKSERGYKKVPSVLKSLFEYIYKTLEYDSPEIKTPSGVIAVNEETRRLVDSLLKKAIASKETIFYKRIDQDTLDTLLKVYRVIEKQALLEKEWKLLNTYIEAFLSASRNWDNRIRNGYTCYKATGRTSAEKPNIQNIPRNGFLRSSLKPSEGKIFVICDYSNAEMRSLAQVNLDEDKKSFLAEEYSKDPLFDPHLYAALQIYNTEHTTKLTLEQFKHHPKKKKYRTLAKILNFGLAGGLNHISFVSYARGFGVELSVALSEKLCTQWLQIWPEMKAYFERRARIYKHDVLNEQDATYHFIRSNRERYCRKYTVSCNTPFQGICADGAKDALIQVYQECFFKRESPLFGSRIVMFIHDEIVLETEDNQERASKAAYRLSKIMEECMEKHTPDVPAIAEPCLSRVWTKDAESQILADGLLEIYEGREEVEEEEEEEEVEVDLDIIKKIGQVIS
tara:strand:+ start:698 stop:2824 length:2127 start_codon:yes stop_codon:yes gene_type:complete